jgi:hypothetical protein
MSPKPTKPKPNKPLSGYLVSLPERLLRSVTALAGGLVQPVTVVALPAGLRRTRLYRSLVDVTLRFLIEQVGEVEGVYPCEEKLAQNFLVRRTAGNGIELAGILAFRASPVWVMAALADLSGTGRNLIREISESLKQEGLLPPDARFETVDQMLDGLEQTAGRVAETINTPPLDVGELREELAAIRRHAASIPPRNLPSVAMLEARWNELKAAAAREDRSPVEMSAVLAVSALRNLPENVRWLSLCAGHAARTTGEFFASGLFDHYRIALSEISKEGYLRYWLREFRPYLAAAGRQFSPRRSSLTQRLLHR